MSNEFNLGLIEVDLGSLEQKAQLLTEHWVELGKTFSGKHVKDALRKVYHGANISQNNVSRTVHRVMGKYASSYVGTPKTFNSEQYIEYSPSSPILNEEELVAKAEEVKVPNLNAKPVGGVSLPEQLGYKFNRTLVRGLRAIKLWNMNSSSLYDAGYDETTESLILSFNTNPNRVYVRQHVPAFEWVNLLKSDSRGQYYHEEIKDEYDVTTSELI